MLIQTNGWSVLMAEAGEEDGAGGVPEEAFGKSYEQIFAERDARESGLPVETPASENAAAPEENAESTGTTEEEAAPEENAAPDASAKNEDPPESSWIKSTTGRILEKHGLDPSCFKDEAAALRTIDQIERTRQRRQQEFEQRRLAEMQQQQQRQSLSEQGAQPRFPPQQQAPQQQAPQQQAPQQQQPVPQLRDLVAKVKEIDFGGEMNQLIEMLAENVERQQRKLEQQDRYLGYIQEQELRSFEDAVLRTTAEVGGNLIDKEKLNAVFGFDVPENKRSDDQRRAIGTLMTNAAGYMSGNFGGEKLPLNKDTIEMILVKHLPNVRVDVNSRVQNAKALQSQAARKMGSGTGSRMVVNAPASSRDPNDRDSRAGLHALFNDMRINQT